MAKNEKETSMTEEEFKEFLLDVMYPIDYSFNEKPKEERNKINKEFKKQHGFDYETFIIARRCAKMDKAHEAIAGRKETPKVIAEMPLNYLAIFSDWLRLRLGRNLAEESADILQQAYDLWQEELAEEKRQKEAESRQTVADMLAPAEMKEFKKYLKDCLSCDYDTMDEAKRRNAYDLWQESIAGEENES